MDWMFHLLGSTLAKGHVTSVFLSFYSLLILSLHLLNEVHTHHCIYNFNLLTLLHSPNLIPLCFSFMTCHLLAYCARTEKYSARNEMGKLHPIGQLQPNSFFLNKILLEQGNAHSIIYYLWLFL